MSNYSYEGEKFLSYLYRNMHNTKEVLRASNISDKKLERIKKYLDRQEEVHYKIRNFGKLELLKRYYYNNYCIKEVPSSYIEYLNKIEYDKNGNYLSDKEIRKITNIIIEDQKNSLSIWIDYLTSRDTLDIPWWAKYFIFMGVVKIGSYNKSNNTYSKRTSSTVAPFIELDKELLHKSYEFLINSLNEGNLEDVSSFSKIYLSLIKDKKKTLLNKDIDGIWKKFPMGDDYLPLYNSLEGYNTGWCTAARMTCKEQVSNGDFYVYYTKDNNNLYKVPRLAIRMNDTDEIAEIRGVGAEQNVEEHLEDVLEEKLKEFPDKDKYKKRINDSKMLTLIYNKINNCYKLNKEELKFIFEIDDYISSFGYFRDPRIKEIKNRLDIKESYSIIYESSIDDIVLREDYPKHLSIQEYEEIFNKNIKVFIGDIEIFDSELPSNFKFPEIVNGSISLPNIHFLDDITFPKVINGNLDLYNLKEANNVELPRRVNELFLFKLESLDNIELPSVMDTLYLDNIKSTNNLKLPNNMKSLSLASIEEIENFKFPEKISGNLDLSGTKKLDNVILPRECSSIHLGGLKFINNTSLPVILDGSMFMSSIEYLSNIVFPSRIEYLNLDSLKAGSNVVLPEKIRYNLCLSNLEKAEGITMPEEVGNLYLNSLETTEGLKLPRKIKKLFLSGYITKKDINLENIEVSDIVFPVEFFGSVENIHK